MPWIIIALWSDKSAAIRFKAIYAASHAVNTVNDLICSHVVNAGVKPHFAHEHKARFFHCGIHLFQFIRNVRRGDQVLFMFQAVFCQVDMQMRRHQGNHYICTHNQRFALSDIGDIDNCFFCKRAAIDLFINGFSISIGYYHVPLAT